MESLFGAGWLVHGSSFPKKTVGDRLSLDRSGYPGSAANIRILHYEIQHILGTQRVASPPNI